MATQVDANASAPGHLVTMLDEVNDTFEGQPEVVLADAGCCNEADLVALEQRGIDAHVALGREGKARVTADSTDPTGDISHGREARPRQGQGSVRQAQVVVRGTERLGEGGVGIPAVQCAWLGEGARRMASGVLGTEHQAVGSDDGVPREPRTECLSGTKCT